jgi:hypothetical protein
LSRKLILFELNEINFDLVQEYTSLGKFKKNSAFFKIFAGNFIKTSSENNYEELEPWIQWVSVHTGQRFKDHKVFRLGEIERYERPQIFEKIEKKGYSVGCISPINAANRLEKPAYFIPDPWTNTKSDGTFWGNTLSSVIKQVVNDNSQSKITTKNYFYIVLSILRFARLINYKKYIQLAIRSIKYSWNKALFLDLLLHDIHLSLFERHGNNFSTIFLNAGAHIQHHYFFNSIICRSALKNPPSYAPPDADPIYDMLQLYDHILSSYLEMNEVELIIATGLSQKPYDRKKFYYRLKNHDDFMRQLGIKFDRIQPRMTRDFLVEFNSPTSAKLAEDALSKILVLPDGLPLFGKIENLGKDLFITLTFPNEITKDCYIYLNHQKIFLTENLAFVAIKNGMHSDVGYAYFSPGLQYIAPKQGSHIKSIFDVIDQYFQ